MKIRVFVGVFVSLLYLLIVLLFGFTGGLVFAPLYLYVIYACVKPDTPPQRPYTADDFKFLEVLGGRYEGSTKWTSDDDINCDYLWENSQ